MLVDISGLDIMAMMPCLPPPVMMATFMFACDPIFANTDATMFGFQLSSMLFDIE